jgi:hypothetical protein
MGKPGSGGGVKPLPSLPGTLSVMVFSSDLEPVQTRITATPNGPVLSLESDTFNATLPASPFILELLANKLGKVAYA